jgi:hypothetical protein
MRRKFAEFMVWSVPAAQMEGLRPSKSPRKLYRCELSGFVPPELSRKLISVIFPKTLAFFKICGIIDNDSKQNLQARKMIQWITQSWVVG